MEDPWAAPSWSTPAKPSSSSPSRPISLSPPPPDSHFDVSDPWGDPAQVHPPTLPRHDVVDTPAARQETVSTPGWGNESSWASGEVPMPKPPEASGSSRYQADETPSWGDTADFDQPIRSSFESTHLSATPPRAFSPLPDFTSPRSPFSVNSPQSHRSMTPAIGSPQEEDPEAAFAAALPGPSANDLPKFDMPKSPSFGDGEFGGFSSGLGDPWEGKAGWGGATGDAADGEEEEDEEAEEGEGWGSVRQSATSRKEPSGMEQDWEAAQRKIQLQESLIPHDKLERLRNGWKEVAGAVIGLRKLPDPTQEEEDIMAQSLRKLEADRDETLRSLAAIPSDINTYPPVLSSFTTHTTYQSSLNRPNPAPSTSLLVITSKRPRRTDTAEEATTPWLSRSRLGEPETSVPEAVPQEQETKSRWAFWGRRPQVERQLTTSGGGVLEVKNVSAATSGSADMRKSVRERSPSVTSAWPSVQSPATSRPASIFEAPIDITSPTAIVSPNPIASPSGAASTHPPTQPPAPSAVSRFFGRLRRNPSSGPLPEKDENKDLELGEDDFSFLDQVPSLAPPKQDGGLFDLQSGRGEDIAGLESMIASKPTPLPMPLAPPPKFAAPVYSRSNSGTGPSQPKKSAKMGDMDLLSGLYDGEGDIAGPPAGAGKSDPIGWDDFLAPTEPTSRPASTAPVLAPPPLRSQSPLPPLPVPTPPRPSVTSKTSFSDFDDFGTPQKGTTSSATFDDFDDFADFESATPPSLPVLSVPPKAPVTAQTPLPSRVSSLATPSIRTHKPRQSLDHTPTLDLLNTASASRGKRWPAPPSPDVPELPPPPQAPTYAPSSGFPFLSPPPAAPGSRSSSALGRQVDLFDTPEQPSSQGSMSPVSGLTPMANMSMMPTPLRSGTPVAVPAEKAPPKPANIAGKGGLSAQDLSFFDNL